MNCVIYSNISVILERRMVAWRHCTLYIILESAIGGTQRHRKRRSEGRYGREVGEGGSCGDEDMRGEGVGGVRGEGVGARGR